jgi:hypothetical protein
MLHQRQGVDQLTFSQWVPHNRTFDFRSVSECAAAAVAAGTSIFQCFASYKFHLGGHSIKSLQLSHKCPLTGYHQACPLPEMPRTYNCACSTIVVPPADCVVLHLSMQESFYESELAKSADEEKDLRLDRRDVLASTNELLVIANYSRIAVPDR